MNPTGWALGFVRDLPDKIDIVDQELRVRERASRYYKFSKSSEDTVFGRFLYP
jgi:hypothetical protein